MGICISLIYLDPNQSLKALQEKCICPKSFGLYHPYQYLCMLFVCVEYLAKEQLNIILKTSEVTIYKAKFRICIVLSIRLSMYLFTYPVVLPIVGTPQMTTQ